MTTPSFIAAEKALVTSGSVTVTTPAGVDSGDLLLASIVTTEGSTVDTPPAGWTLLTGYPIVSHTSGARQYVYERAADGTEAADYTWSQTGAKRMGGIIVAYETAVRVAGAVANEATRTSTPTQDPPVPTGSLTQADDTRWVALLAIFGGNLTNLAVHSSQTRRAHQVDSPMAIAAGDDVPTADGNRNGQATGSLGLGFSSWDRVGTLISIQHGALPPNAPDLDDVDTFDAANAQTLTWTFKDPNVGDTQASRRVEIVNVNGTAAVDTGKVADTSESYSLAASTLTNENTYQWRVKTWDQGDLEGPWSDWETFDVSAAPTVSITAPTASQVVTESSLLVEWDYTHAARSQGWRQVELLDGATVVHDSGKDATAQTSYQLTDLLDAKSYTVRVTVWSDLDLASTPDTQDFTTDFDQPPAPTLTVTTDAANGLISVRIQNPTPGAGETDPDWNDVERREAATASAVAGAWVRIATGVDLQGLVEDRTAASGVAYEYRAIAVSTEFEDTTGPTSSEVTLTLTSAWLHDVVDPPATALAVTQANRRSVRVADDHALVQYAGRTFPVAEWGEHKDEQVSVTVTLPSDQASVDTLLDLLRSQATLCYRDQWGRVMFTSAPAADVTDHIIGGGDVSVTLHAVDFDEKV